MLEKAINLVILNISRLIILNSTLENMFRMLCSQPETRSFFRLGVIAYGFTRFLKERKIRLANFDNYSIYVNIAEPLGIRSYFMKDNPVPWFVKDLIHLGDFCLDIGSNMGHYALLMASMVGNRGKVIAFEPNANYSSLIQQSINRNQYQSCLTVDQRALWHQSGETLKFYLSDNPNNSGTSSLRNHGLYLKEDLYTVVSTTTLSDVSQEHGIDHYKLIKIDVERVEYEVLMGGQQYLVEHKIDYIVLETEMNSDALKLVQENGYSSYLINYDKKMFVNTHSVRDGFFGDYLLVSPGQISYFMSHFQEQLYENQ